MIGQILLAKRMGKKKVIAETGAGQHGVATATGAALFDMECTVYMGSRGYQKTVTKRNAHGDARRESCQCHFRKQYAKGCDQRGDPHLGKNGGGYLLHHRFCCGTVSVPEDGEGVSERHQPRGEKQILAAEGKLPDVVMACVGGGSNSIGMFADFIEEKG